jgi:hypothetical protein
MKKIEEQIEGQLNIFDCMGQKPPEDFRQQPKKDKPKGICEGCLFDDGPCFWLDSKTPCIRGMSRIREKDGWHRLNKGITTPGRTNGAYPTNTNKREKVDIIMRLETNELFVTFGEGINEALILQRGTPKGQIVAWRYRNRGNEYEYNSKNEKDSEEE